MHAALVWSAAISLAACGSTGAPPPAPLTTVERPPALSTTVGPPPGQADGSAATDTDAPPVVGNIEVSTVVTGLRSPWGLAFLPDGSALVTERDTALVKQIRQGQAIELGAVADVDHGGEGGLLGLAVSPDFDRNGHVFVYFTTADDNRIVRLTLRDGALSDPQPLLTGIPKAGVHNGGRLRFGPDGLLYVGTGDAGDRSNAQNLSSLGGKILRITEDGAPAPDNPFAEAPMVYSYGHRNVQGLAFDDSGRLWASEFGQNTWDELNLITSGGNYGWPVVEGPGERDDFIPPQQVWPTNEASPSGIAVAQHTVWMASLRGMRLWQIPITTTGDPAAGGTEAVAGSATATPIARLTDTYGRLRTVEPAPDGALWLVTSNTDGRGNAQQDDDRILRLGI